MTAPRMGAAPVGPTARLREHPAAAAVPAMRPAEWAGFLADVAERGIVEPVRVAADGVTVLDGRHRLRAARELGLVAVPLRPADCPPGEEAAYALRAALHRRHLTDDQRAMLAVRLAAQLGAERGHLQRQAASRARWGPPAGRAADTADPGGGSVVAHHPSRTAATRALGVSRQRFEAARQLTAAAPDLAAQVEAGSLPLPAARKSAERRDALAELAAQPRVELPAGDAELWQGDCFELAARIPDASIDVLMTDPPFTTAGMVLWPAFGRLAARVLRPGGWCLVYAGVLALPDELAALAAGSLVYWWTIAIGLRGPSPVIHLRGARSAWRPVLIFVKPPSPGVHAPLFRDHLLHATPAEKSLHPWQQAVGPARQLIRRFALPGALVLDPFAGSGTFSIAALLEGRRTLAIEIDPGHAATARQRIAAALAERGSERNAG